MSEQEPQKQVPEVEGLKDPGIEYKDQLQVRQLFAGIRVLTSTPTHNGMKGEIVAVSDDSSTFQFYIYLNNDWKKLGDVDFANYVDKTDFNAKGDIFVATANDTYTRRAVGDDDLVLTADSSESDGVKWASPIPEYTAGDVCVLSHAELVGIAGSSGDASLAKKLQFTVDKAGTLRVKFSARATSSGVGENASIRVYRNGSAVGTARATGNANGSIDWNEFTEDISGWSAGDTCELWLGKASGSFNVYAKWFRACADDDTMIQRPVEYVRTEHTQTTVSSTNVWEDWDLESIGSADGNSRICSDAKYADVLIYSTSTSQFNADVRENLNLPDSSSITELNMNLDRDSGDPPIVHRMVRTVESTTIEKIASHATEIEFALTGFWL